MYKVANCNVKVTLNNTIITISDNNTNKVLGWSSSGRAGFKNSRRATAHAAEQAAKKVVPLLHEHNMQGLHIIVKGPFLLNKILHAVVRGLFSPMVEILSIKDANVYPHNGCRPKKTRRM